MNMLRDLERGKIVEAVSRLSSGRRPEMPQLQERLDRFLKAIPDLRAGRPW